METIKTFIFMDLETTGLPQNENISKITEIALVAARREDILKTKYDVSKENNSTYYLLPRVLNKITFPVFPCKMIQPMASIVSGLTNENLEHQRAFDKKTFELLTLFLERHEKPICLVAHNGNRFDFPILKAEISKIGKEFPDDLFCADSFVGFREVLTKQSDKKNITSIVPPGSKINNAASLLPKCDWSDDEYNEEMVQATELVESLTQQHSAYKVEELEVQLRVEMERIRKINESTPVRRKRFTVRPNDENGGARRKILADKQPKLKFNMKSLYEHIMKKELVDAHRAESDTLALLECVTAIGLPILEWMDRNQIPFKNIRKLW